MPKINAATANAVMYNGTHGNLCCAVLKANLAAVAAGTDVVMGQFDGNKVEVTDYRLHHDALGSGVTLSVGHGQFDDSADDNDSIGAAAASASAGSKRMAKAPVKLTEPSQILLGVAGGTASGEATLTLFYTVIE